ncbi:hypothetical protein [Bacillus cereus group sp. BfR-BA-01316]|uniref:hypothetical protein n=1 Tax=Bacillus cereus group sp. BfR-BA-01316 TaxID=2920293 RepID=UPI001F564093|nr:hypothetical protein [Bacillus cereus group sp. BfR-BA-01316]
MENEKEMLTIIIYRCNIEQVADSNNAESDKRNKKTWLTLKYENVNMRESQMSGR